MAKPTEIQSVSRRDPSIPDFTTKENNKDHCTTGAYVSPGYESEYPPLPPPQEALVLRPPNERQYECSSSDEYSEYNQELSITNQTLNSTHNDTYKDFSPQSPKHRSSTSAVSNQLSSKCDLTSKKPANSFIRNISGPVSGNSSVHSKEWMPMRQLFNAHKL